MGLMFTAKYGQTLIDEQEKLGLKVPISTQFQLNELEQLNIENAIAWTLTRKLDSTNVLTEQFVKQLHKKMYGSVWKWAGEFRKTEKNIGVKAFQIPTELKYLLDDVIFWVEHQTYSPEEIAIRFKHRLVSIHCFPNGNGRHSRLMADCIMTFVFRLNAFSWNQSNLVSTTTMRKTYIGALKQADAGCIKSLIEFAKS